MRHFYLTVLFGVLACGGGGTDAGPTSPPVTPTPPAVPVVTTISVALGASPLAIGSTAPATATILDQNHAPIAGKTVTWTSESESVALVNSAGTVVGIGAGTTNIVASVDGKQGRAAVTVAQSAATSATAWTLDATVFTTTDFGPSAVGGINDAAVIPLKDGRYRMFMGGHPIIPPDSLGVHSAISSDGVHFTMESGRRVIDHYPVTPTVNVRWLLPFAIRLDDGRVRLVLVGTPVTGCCTSTPGAGSDAIYSFISSDEGVTFTLEPGTRLTQAEAPQLASLDSHPIVQMKTGGWRMYIGDNPPTITTSTGFMQLGVGKIMSATSPDMLTWTMEPGIRLGPGGALPGSSQEPAALVNDDGSVTLVYFRNTPAVTMQSTSMDGLSFTTESSTGFGNNDRLAVPGGNPFLMRLSTGDVRMYFNWGNDLAGSMYTAHRPPYAAGR